MVSIICDVPPKQTAAVMPLLMLRGHTGQVRGVVHLPDGRRIVTCSDDGSLRLWDLESGTQIGDDWRDEGMGIVFSIASSPNGRTIASGSADGIVRLWDVETGKVIAKWTGHTESVYSVCWSGDSKRVASESSDGMVRVLDAESGETLLGPIKTEHLSGQVSYSPDNTKIATGGAGDGARIWDANTGELLFKEYDAADTTYVRWGTPFIRGLVWTSDGRKLIVASFLSVVIWTAALKPTAVLHNHGGIVQGISLSQNDRILAIASNDFTARVWNLDTNLQIGLPLLHEGRVNCVALSGDGKVLVTGGHDGTVYVWDMYAILKEAGLDSGLLSIPSSRSTELQKQSQGQAQASSSHIQPAVITTSRSKSPPATTTPDAAVAQI